MSGNLVEVIWIEMVILCDLEGFLEFLWFYFVFLRIKFKKNEKMIMKKLNYIVSDIVL